MPRFSFLAPLLFVLPLAACFDAELTVTFPDDNTAEATTVMIASAEFYEMSASSGESFCDDGEETILDDGRYSCTQSFGGTIDEAVNDPNIGEGMTIERRAGGLLYVSYDLSEITSDIAAPEEVGGEEMMAMMAASFEGRSIIINVAGRDIVETNGELAPDGKSARFTIPLDALLTGTADLPASFDVLLRPGT